MKRMIVVLCIAMFASKAQAASMFQIGDEGSWLNADKIVAMGSLTREEAGRVDFGVFSIRGEVDESVSEDAKFCKVLTQKYSWTFAYACEDILRMMQND